MSWYESIRKYVWDETTTPYFVRVDKLNQAQARKEIFVYTVFLAFLFAVLTVLSLPDPGPQRDVVSLVAPALAFSLFCAAILLGVSKHFLAALYCIAAPVAAFLIIVVAGPHPDLHLIDKIVLLVFCLAWLRYALRVAAIARAFPALPEREG